MTKQSREEEGVDGASFEKATKLRDEGKLAESATILSELARANPDSSAVSAVLGNVFNRLGKTQDAIRCFKHAVCHAPTSELASLALFHCLWSDGQQRAAAEELKRYMASNKVSLR